MSYDCDPHYYVHILYATKLHHLIFIVSTLSVGACLLTPPANAAYPRLAAHGRLQIISIPLIFFWGGGVLDTSPAQY